MFVSLFVCVREGGGWVGGSVCLCGCAWIFLNVIYYQFICKAPLLNLRWKCRFINLILLS